MAAFMREHYDTSWLPTTVVQHIARVEIDHGRGRAILHLDDGTTLIDYGDRVVIDATTDRAIKELIQATDRHGWSQPGGLGVHLFGPADFRRRAAIEMMDRSPPVRITGLDETDWKAVAEDLRRRAERRCQKAAAVLKEAEQRALAAWERWPGDQKVGAALAAVRDAQAAAARNDDATIRKAASGDVSGALRAAEAWRQRAMQTPAPEQVEAPQDPRPETRYVPPWLRRGRREGKVGSRT